MSKTNITIIALVAIGVAGIVWWQLAANSASQAVEINMPALDATQTAGQKLYEANCASCHGTTDGGTDKGPPLIHIYYEPNHHPDAAFYSAAAIGTRQHHWKFGNMPAVKEVNQDDVTKIIAFVRAVQRANGIK
ncbi:MAG: cytochrome c [Hyphomicrobiales bacterium]|nr:cytochrome c [Hyphomicrobiales bacterium]